MDTQIQLPQMVLGILLFSGEFTKFAWDSQDSHILGSNVHRDQHLWGHLPRSPLARLQENPGFKHSVKTSDLCNSSVYKPIWERLEKFKDSLRFFKKWEDLLNSKSLCQFTK